MNRALLFVLIVLVVASAALNALLFRRQKEMEKRLDAVENRPSPKSRTSPSDAPAEDLDRAELRGPGPQRDIPSEPERRIRRDNPSGTADLGSSGDTSTSSSSTALPPDLRAAIAKEIEQQLSKRGPGMFEVQDPVKVMEAELNLSPSQLVRIKELLKKKTEEQVKVHDEGLKMSETMKRFQEIDKRYDDLIKQELDLEQQKKYEELKKSNKLMTGAVIRFGAKKDDE